MRVRILFLSTLLPLIGLAQALPEELFIPKKWKNPPNQMESGLSKQLADVYVADIQWTKKYGGAQGDVGYSVQKTFDGGFIIVGETGTLTTTNDVGNIYIIKTDRSGTVQWSKTYGGSLADEARHVQQTSDSGYIVTALTTSYGNGEQDAYFLKLDSNGAIIWHTTYGGTNYDRSYCTFEVDNRNLIQVGYSWVGDTYYGGGYAWVRKVNSSGSEIWVKTYSEANKGYYFNYGVPDQFTGGFVFAGSILNGIGFDAYDDGLSMMTNSTGVKQWQKTFGGSNSDQFDCVKQTADGGFIFAGSSVVNGKIHALLVRTDPSGTSSWSNTYGGGLGESATSVVERPDGGFVFVGHTFSYAADKYDMYIVRTDRHGTEKWHKNYGGLGYDNAFCAENVNDSEFVVLGYDAESSFDNQDVALLKFKEVAPLEPDLIIDSLRVAYVNDTLWAYFNLTNNGNSTMPPGIDVALYCNDSLMWTFDTTSVELPRFFYFGPYWYYDENIDTTEVTIRVCADYSNKVQEIDEANNCATESISITLPVNSPPEITIMIPDTFTVDSLYTIPMTANDLDGDSLIWTTLTKPDNLQLVGENIIWAPNSTNWGLDSIVLVVSDGKSADTLRQYLYVIKPTSISDPLENHARPLSIETSATRIMVTFPTLNGRKSVALYSMSGRILHSVELNGKDRTVIDLGAINSATSLYLLRVTHPEGTINRTVCSWK